MSTLTQTPSARDTAVLVEGPQTIEAVDGTPLFVRGPIGDSGPPVVALHGLADSGAGYIPVLLRAAHGHRAWALDFRGHGRSGHTRGGYGLDDYVGDAVALLEAIGEPCVVVGSGLGACVARALAQDDQPLVSAVFLEEPFRSARESESATARRLEAAVGPLRAVGAITPAYEALALGDSLLADARTTRAAALKAVDTDVLRAVLDGRTFAGFDPGRRLQVPAIVVRAARGEAGGRERWCDGLSEFLARTR